MDKTKTLRLGMRYITRMKYERSVGWNVRFLVHGVNPWSRMFSDGVYGGELKALAAAKAWRDEVVRGNGASVGISATGSCFHHQTRNNRSGMVGVIPMIDRRGVARVVAWRATWQKNGATERVTFSVVKFGYEVAFRLAVEKRAQALGTLAPKVVAPPGSVFLAGN